MSSPLLAPFVPIVALAALLAPRAQDAADTSRTGSVAPPPEAAAPPSRALLLALTERPRVAGTSGSEWGAQLVARVLADAGWDVERDERVVLLSLPRRLEAAAFDAEGRELFRRVERYDPDAAPPGELPPCLAWSASGTARGPVVDAGRGMRADFEALVAAGVELEGTIALARYGGCYRGVKAAMAQEFGCAGLALYSASEDDGPDRGASWPNGPWKSPDHVQRGSILPISNTPGDPSTPGWPSPAPGEDARRVTEFERDAALPNIVAQPIPLREARAVLEHLDGAGPGPVELELTVDQPRDFRRIVNVVARLAGDGDGLVVVGNHRDAWVRGAHDAGGGTVALMRAAQRLAERRADGWSPRGEVVLAFWDAEETGLVGSTEWVEAHADQLTRRLIAYVNADAAVTGPHFNSASGSPGFERVLADALTPIAATDRANQLERWRALRGADPRVRFAGSGSDYTAFLHHLCLPVLDIGFGGNAGGQYHTRFDDFAVVDRFLDPGFVGHERAAQLIEELVVRLDAEGRAAFDEAACCDALAELARSTAFLGEARAERLARGFESLAEVLRAAPNALDGRMIAALAAPDGLPGRPWFRNALWAPGLETGYAPESFPALAAAARGGDDALDAALAAQLAALRALEERAMTAAIDAERDDDQPDDATGR